MMSLHDLWRNCCFNNDGQTKSRARFHKEGFNCISCCWPFNNCQKTKHQFFYINLQMVVLHQLRVERLNCSWTGIKLQLQPLQKKPLGISGSRVFRSWTPFLAPKPTLTSCRRAAATICPLSSQRAPKRLVPPSRRQRSNCFPRPTRFHIHRCSLTRQHGGE